MALMRVSRSKSSLSSPAQEGRPQAVYLARLPDRLARSAPLPGGPARHRARPPRRGLMRAADRARRARPRPAPARAPSRQRSNGPSGSAPSTRAWVTSRRHLAGGRRRLASKPSSYRRQAIVTSPPIRRHIAGGRCHSGQLAEILSPPQPQRPSVVGAPRQRFPRVFLVRAAARRSRAGDLRTVRCLLSSPAGA